MSDKKKKPVMAKKDKNRSYVKRKERKRSKFNRNNSEDIGKGKEKKSRRLRRLRRIKNKYTKKKDRNLAGEGEKRKGDDMKYDMDAWYQGPYTQEEFFEYYENEGFDQQEIESWWDRAPEGKIPKVYADDIKGKGSYKTCYSTSDEGVVAVEVIVPSLKAAKDVVLEINLMNVYSKEWHQERAVGVGHLDRVGDKLICMRRIGRGVLFQYLMPRCKRTEALATRGATCGSQLQPIEWIMYSIQQYPNFFLKLCYEIREVSWFHLPTLRDWKESDIIKNVSYDEDTGLYNILYDTYDQILAKNFFNQDRIEDHEKKILVNVDFKPENLCYPDKKIQALDLGIQYLFVIDKIHTNKVEQYMKYLFLGYLCKICTNNEKTSWIIDKFEALMAEIDIKNIARILDGNKEHVRTYMLGGNLDGYEGVVGFDERLRWYTNYVHVANRQPTYRQPKAKRYR